MLVSRFRNNQRAALQMNRVQRNARDRTIQKIVNGEYQLEEVNCPSCNSDRRSPISAKDGYGIPIGVVVCNACAFIYTSPRFNHRSLVTFYNTEYRQLERGVPLPQDDFFQLEKEKGEMIFHFLDQAGLIPPNKTKWVVEVGCGAGGILDVFREKGFPVMGSDLGDEYIAFGREKHGLDLFQGGIQEVKARLAQEKRVPGIIIYEQAFEHMPNPITEFQQLYEIMDDNAVLFVGVPGLRDIDNHYESDFLKFLQPGHLLHFDLKSLSQIASRAGFERLVGDEMVRAAFRKRKPRVDSGNQQTAEEVKMFLIEMEQRRRKKALKNAPKNAAKMLVRLVIALLPLPSEKKKALLSRIKSLVLKRG